MRFTFKGPNKAESISKSEMRIYLGRGLWTVIDKSDYNLVKGYRWILAPLRKESFYARSTRRKDSPEVLMHVLLMGRNWIDHINGDKLDNRRSNLRFCNRSQNMMNSKTRRDNISGYRGISYRPKKKLWQARITINGKTISLGLSKSKEKAYGFYVAAAKKYFKEFSRV